MQALRTIPQAATTAALGAIAALALSGTFATTARSGPLTITRWSVDCGGIGFSRVGTWTLAGTVGQPDAGSLSGSPYQVVGGFWGAIPLNVTAVATPDPTDPADPGAAAPTIARALPAAPNPTDNGTRFAFDLPEARAVRIQVFTVGGALVRTVTDQIWRPGRHEVSWDGRDAGGAVTAAGVYFVRVRLGSLERTQKLLIVR